jgi:hypothetical protein
MQRRLVMLMCARCNDDVTLHETERAFHWRISLAELAETKDLFLEKEFIDKDWNLINWNKRQFLSDSSTDRVRKYRQGLKQDETLLKHHLPVTVTAPDTEQIQNRTEQKHKKHIASTADAIPAASVFDLPLVGGKQCFAVSQELFDEFVRAYPGVVVMAELGRARAWLISNPIRGKTLRGMPKFLNSWLSRAQDRGGNGNGSHNGNGFQAESSNEITNRNIKKALEKRLAAYDLAHGVDEGEQAEPEAAG